MKLLFYTSLIYYLLIPSKLLAQKFHISGKLSDENKEAIAFATIGLLAIQDSSLITGAVSDYKGEFQIKNIDAGNYIMKIQHLQYEVKFNSIVLGQNQKLEIQLNALTTGLDEIVVVGDKEKLQNNVDVHSINVDQSTISAGGTAVDVLKSSPIVTVGMEGDISIRGKSDIQILVNGRPSGFAALQGARFLEQLDASSIERIEIITNPSAKDSPYGGGGVINIILKKQAEEGLNGSIQAFGGNGRRFGFSPNVNYRMKDFNFFVNYNLRRNTRITNSDNIREQNLSLIHI